MIFGWKDCFDTPFVKKTTFFSLFNFYVSTSEYLEVNKTKYMKNDFKITAKYHIIFLCDHLVLLKV